MTEEYLEDGIPFEVKSLVILCLTMLRCPISGTQTGAQIQEDLLHSHNLRLTLKRKLQTQPIWVIVKSSINRPF